MPGARVCPSEWARAGGGAGIGKKKRKKKKNKKNSRLYFRIRTDLDRDVRSRRCLTNMSKKNKQTDKNIIILGAGFGGLRTALLSAKNLPLTRGYAIHLIDREAHHLYTPLLYEVASGYFHEEMRD